MSSYLFKECVSYIHDAAPVLDVIVLVFEAPEYMLYIGDRERMLGIIAQHGVEPRFTMPMRQFNREELYVVYTREIGIIDIEDGYGL